MAVLRSLVFALVFYTATLGAVLWGLLILPFGAGPHIRLVRWWTAMGRACAERILGIRIVVEGPVPVGPVLIAAKHESMIETLVLVNLLGHPVPVLKQELTRIPLFGLAVNRWGAIPIDRAGSAATLRRMVIAARAVIAAGRPILIFPEGTRVPPGERPPLRAGFAGLYRAIGVPVVPVALDSGRLWPKGLVKRPGLITFRFGAPIAPGLSRADVEARVHAAINALNGSPA